MDDMAVGRPSTFNAETADVICEYIATSTKSLRHICAEIGIEVRTVLRWLADEKNEEFRHQYARAKEEQADMLAEEILEIADDSTKDTKQICIDGTIVNVEDKEWVNRSKIRIDARKWLATKLKPKKYGDKTEQSVVATNINYNATVSPEEAKEISKCLDEDY